MKPFNILALNANFEIVSIVSFTSLQWSRKYHEPGSFCFSVPLGQYTDDWKYIYTPDRPEMGEITQINYVSREGFAQMYISGYFLENELNKMVVYPYSQYVGTDEGTILIGGFPGSIYNQPNWTKQNGSAQTVAHAFFNGFKKLWFRNYVIGGADALVDKTYELDIQDGTSDDGIYKITEDTRNGEQLGDKIYQILKPSGASYRVRFDFDNSKKYFDVILGKDKTEDSTSNNPVIFSTKYGNITNPNVVISDNDYKDGVIQHIKNTTPGHGIDSQGNSLQGESVAVLPNVLANAKGYFVYKEGKANLNDYFIQDVDFQWRTYKKVVMADAEEELKDRGRVINVDFDALEGSYEYMSDFDIGDLVSIEIPEINFSADARLIGCYETIQDGKWNISLEFGTPIIKR